MNSQFYEMQNDGSLQPMSFDDVPETNLDKEYKRHKLEVFRIKEKYEKIINVLQERNRRLLDESKQRSRKDNA